jgi:hypothetical protein
MANIAPAQFPGQGIARQKTRIGSPAAARIPTLPAMFFVSEEAIPAIARQ